LRRSEFEIIAIDAERRKLRVNPLPHDDPAVIADADAARRKKKLAWIWANKTPAERKAWLLAHSDYLRNYHQKYRQENAERIEAKKRRWRESNYSQYQNYHRQYREAHSERIAKYQSEYRARNLDRLREANRVRTRLNRDKNNLRSREWRKANREQANAKRRAKRGCLRAAASFQVWRSQIQTL